MILNEDQLADIRQELNYAVRYKETYDEVYDHVLLAIEATDNAQIIYTTTVTKQVIDEEFGGYETLKSIEKDSIKLMNKAMRKKHWQNIRQFFNIPVIGFTLAATVAAYFISGNMEGRKILLGFVSVISVMPLSFLLLKRLVIKIREWYFGVFTKQSLKENYILIAALLSNSLFNLLNAENHRILMNGGVTMLFFVFYTIYVLSFFKLYQDEFKMNIAR